MFATATELEKASDALDDGDFGDTCDAVLVGRARWDYADALDTYARSHRASSPVARSYSQQAAEAFEAYLDFVKGLSADQFELAIRRLKQAERMSDAQFAPIRASFLRGRIGNAINSMSQSRIRAGDYAGFFDSLEEFANLPIECFPREVVLEWYKWLRSQPDFGHERQVSEEIVAVISQNNDCRHRWSTFVAFLERYVNQGGPQRTRWHPILDRARAWL